MDSKDEEFLRLQKRIQYLEGRLSEAQVRSRSMWRRGGGVEREAEAGGGQDRGVQAGESEPKRMRFRAGGDREQRKHSYGAEGAGERREGMSTRKRINREMPQGRRYS